MKLDDNQLSLALDPPAEKLLQQARGNSNKSPSEAILVEIAEVPITGTEAQKYCANLVETGEVLVSKSRCARFEACRVLLMRGISGVVQIRRKGSDAISMVLNIEEAARLDIREGSTTGPRIVPFDPQKREKAMARFRKRLPEMRRKTEVEAKDGD